MNAITAPFPAERTRLVEVCCSTDHRLSSYSTPHPKSLLDHVVPASSGAAVDAGLGLGRPARTSVADADGGGDAAPDAGALGEPLGGAEDPDVGGTDGETTPATVDVGLA